MGPREVGNPPHSSLPPPRPPDPSQFKLKLQAHKEEVAARFSKLGQSMTALAVEQEEFQRELREELRQLRLSYGEPSLPQPHLNTPTTMVSAPPSSNAGTPSSPNYCQLPEPPPIPNCKPQPQIPNPTPPASFTLTQAVVNLTHTQIVNATIPPQFLPQIHHRSNVKPHNMRFKFGRVHRKVRIQSLVTLKRTLSNLPRIMGTHGCSSKSRKEVSSSTSNSRRKRKSDNSESDSYTESDDSNSSDSSPARSSVKRKERSSRRKNSCRKDSDDESCGSDESEERDHKKERSSRNFTQEQIVEYLAKKAQKKAARVARKIKSKIVLGYPNDSNPNGDSDLNEIFAWRKEIERDVSHGASLDVFSVKAQKQGQTSGDSKTTWVNHRVKYRRCKSQKQFLGRYYHRDYGPVKFVSAICISKKCGSVSSIILCFALVYEWSRSGRKLNLKHKCANRDYNEAFETNLRGKFDKAFRENSESMSLVLVQFDRKDFDFLWGLLMRGFKRTEGMNPAKEKLVLQGCSVLSAIDSNVSALSHLVFMSNRRFKVVILMFSKPGEHFVATVLLNKMEKEGNIITAFAFLVKDSVGCIKNSELEESCKEFGHICDEWVKEVYQGAFDNYLNTLKGSVGFGWVSIYESLEGWLGSYFASMVTAVEQSAIFISKQGSTLKQMDSLGLGMDVGMLISIHANFNLFVSVMACRNLKLDALMNVLNSLRKCKKIRSYYSSNEAKVGGLHTGLHIIVPYSIYWNDSMLEEHDKGLRPYYLHCVANNTAIRSGRFKFIHNGVLLLLAMLFTNNGTLHQFREYNALALCILEKLYESMFIEGAEKLKIIKAQRWPQALYQGMMLCKSLDQDEITLLSLMSANSCLEARYLPILITSMVSVGTETTVYTFLDDGNLQIHQLGTHRVNTVKAYTATFSHVMNKNSIAVSGINSRTIGTCSLVISNGAFEVILKSRDSLGEEDSNPAWLYFILKLGLILGLVVYTSRMQPEHEHVIGSNINQFYNPHCGTKWVRVVYIGNQPSSSSIEVIGFLITIAELSHWRYDNITWFLLLNLCTWLWQSLEVIIYNETTSTALLRFLVVNSDSLPEQHHNYLKVTCDLEGMMLFDEDGPMPNTQRVHEVDCQLLEEPIWVCLLLLVYIGLEKHEDMLYFKGGGLLGSYFHGTLYWASYCHAAHVSLLAQSHCEAHPITTALYAAFW